jgi:hypothetical protein
MGGESTGVGATRWGYFSCEARTLNAVPGRVRYGVASGCSKPVCEQLGQFGRGEFGIARSLFASGWDVPETFVPAAPG